LKKINSSKFWFT